LLKNILLSGIVAVSSLTTLPAQATSSNCTHASYYGYGDGFDGSRTANGERFDAAAHTTAHRSLPFGTKLLVTNPANGRSVVVRVNDRGPYIAGRGLDLSHGAFVKLASASSGVARVCYKIHK